MKRQNDDDAPAPAPAKKSRGNTAHAATVALVNSILANPKAYPISGSEDVVRKSLVNLASYARSLELQLAGGASGPVAGSSKAGAAAATKPARSQAVLETAAEKVRKAAVSGIKKQMSAVSGTHTRILCAPCMRPRACVSPSTCPHPVEALVQDGVG